MSDLHRWKKNGNNVERRLRLLGCKSFGDARRLKWSFEREFGAFFMDADWRSTYWNLANNRIV